MGDFANFWSQGDRVLRSVTLLLLGMSVSAWVLIFWKVWVLNRARLDLRRAVPAFWAAASLTEARQALVNFDREWLLIPLLDAGLATASKDTLEFSGKRESQLTRRLRDALHGVLQQLQFGQVLLASIGSTAPFIGLFGTVWAAKRVGLAYARSVEGAQTGQVYAVR